MTITEPGNHFELARRRPEYLLLAASGSRRSTRWRWPWMRPERSSGCSTPAARRDLAFGDELRERLSDRLQVFIDEEGDRVDLTAVEIARLAPGGEFYVCGPIGLLEATKRAWQDSGRPGRWPAVRNFGGNSGRFASQDFTVKIPRLSREVIVPRNQTMLEALEDAGSR